MKHQIDPHFHEILCKFMTHPAKMMIYFMLHVSKCCMFSCVLFASMYCFDFTKFVQNLNSNLAMFMVGNIYLFYQSCLFLICSRLSHHNVYIYYLLSTLSDIPPPPPPPPPPNPSSTKQGGRKKDTHLTSQQKSVHNAKKLEQTVKNYCKPSNWQNSETNFKIRFYGSPQVSDTRGCGLAHFGFSCSFWALALKTTAFDNCSSLTVKHLPTFAKCLFFGSDKL